MFFANVRMANYEKRNIIIDLGADTDDDARSIIEMLDKLTVFLQGNSYESCCEICGANTETALNKINNVSLYTCHDCYHKASNNYNPIYAPVAATVVQEKGSNIVTGIVGSLIGSLIGIALWVVVFSLGYIATICGIVLAVCIMKGYELLGGKLDTKGVIISVVITLVMVYVSTHVSYGFEIYRELKAYYDIDVFDGIRSVGDFIKEYDDIRKSFRRDLAAGYLFTIIGVLSSIFSVGKSKK